MNIKWGGQNWTLLPERALYWHEASTLILSDLHLGKAERFQQAGIPISSQIHIEDLNRMRQLLARLHPLRIWILGDFLHTPRSQPTSLVTEFLSLRGQNQTWSLVLGNHDAKDARLLQAWGFDQIVNELVEAGIYFRHTHAKSANQGLSIEGHVHPVVIVGFNRERLRLPCFAMTTQRLLLPAFGEFTGGYEISRKNEQRVCAIAEGRIYEVSKSQTICAP